MAWRISQYRSARGDYPVAAYLDRLGAKDRRVIRRYLEALERLGPALREPQARRLLGTGRALYELRPGPHRLFYCGVGGVAFVLLHAYRKKSQGTPPQELSTAVRRYDEVIANGNTYGDPHG